MKKIILTLAIIGFLSCNREPKTFNGIGEFQLGKDFSSVESSKDFQPTMAGEFNLPEAEFPGQIGKVANLNVSVADGKIVEVSFRTTANSNSEAIEKTFKPTLKLIKEMPIGSEGKAVMRFYASEADSVMVAETEYFDQTMSNAQHPRHYSYINAQGAKRKHEFTQNLIASFKRKG